MSFENSWVLIALIIPLVLTFVSIKKSTHLQNYFTPELLAKMQSQTKTISKKTRIVLLNLSLAFIIVALARLVINNGEIKVKSQYIDTIVAFDISKSMQAKDLYPNRLEFAKQKFFDMLNSFKNARIGVIGFSSRAFLISPLTSDYATLKYLVKNMNLDYISLAGTDILEALKTTNQLLKSSKHKALIIFSDGGDKEGFEEEIAYAKENNIKLFIYGVATKKGGIIKNKNSIVKDKKGNIVVVKLNDKIANLATESGGSFMPYSLKKNDINYLVDDIKAKFKAKTTKENSIKDIKELFYYPLALGLLFFALGIFSFPGGKK